jgi:putative acetyltransferase
MQVAPADLDDPRVIALLDIHVGRSRAETGCDSAHVLDLAALKAADIAIWAAWEGEALLAIGALRRLSASAGEVKSMHTAEAARRTGAGGAILKRIIEGAREAGLSRLSLETGSWAYFEPARAFYHRHGFEDCGPFGDYRLDPNSVFMTMQL